MAAPDTGTSRSFDPFPIATRKPSSRCSAAMSSPHASLARRPQPYSVSSSALSRRSSAPSAPIASSMRDTSAMESTSGSFEGTLGSFSTSMGDFFVYSSLRENLWNPRTADIFLFTVAGAYPTSKSSTAAGSTSSTSPTPKASRCAEYASRSRAYSSMVFWEDPRSMRR